MRVIAASCLLLLATLGAAVDYNRSLLSARDMENIMAAKAYAAKCKGSKSKVGKIHAHVYHVYSGGSGYGLQEHNAGDATGDIGFVFHYGGAGGGALYYHGGYIAMLHVGLTQWGQYLRCNHAPGSHQYSCNGGSYEYAGVESMGGGHWYSFPAAGKDKQWSEIDAKTGPCMMIRIKAWCLFNLAAKAGSCPSGCAKVPNFQQCQHCWSGLSTSTLNSVWDNAIWNKKCKRYEVEENDEEDGVLANTTASTDKDTIIV